MTIEHPGEPTTAEQMLAIVDPLELFGSSTGDERRRKYLRLARRFRPEVEPAAFAHLRALYDGVPRVVVHAPRTEPASTGRSPGAALVHAMERGARDAMVELITAHEVELFANERTLWGVCVCYLLSTDLRCFREADRERIAIRVTNGERPEEFAIARCLDHVQALERLRADRTVPPAVTDALGVWAPWMADADGAWRALCSIGACTADLKEADRLWSRILLEHPGVCVALHGLVVVVRKAAVRHPEPQVWRARVRGLDPARRSMEAWCREWGLFPDELQCRPGSRHEEVQEAVLDDPGAVPRILSDAHRSRWSGR
jgi:hypothetical protein